MRSVVMALLPAQSLRRLRAQLKLDLDDNISGLSNDLNRFHTTESIGGSPQAKLGQGIVHETRLDSLSDLILNKFEFGEFF